MSRIATSGIDYTSRDYEAYKSDMIQFLQKKIPEYTDTRETDAGIVIIEALANGLDSCSMYNEIVANDVVLYTTQNRRIAITLAKTYGYAPYNITSSKTPQVFVLNGVRDVDYIIGKGTVVKTQDSNDSETMYFETLEDLVIPSGKLGNEKDEHGNYLYTVLVQQGTSIKNDILGSTNGTMYQSYRLNYSNALVDTLEVFIDEGEGYELWEQVDSLWGKDYDENSKIYTITTDEYDNTYLDFGNGIRGKIPSNGVNNIYANYRVGGGTQSNVLANTIVEMDSDIAYIESTFNPVASTVLGHDRETLEEIKVNAPAKLRTGDRAVTLQDYGDLIGIHNEDYLFGVAKAIGIQDSINKLQVNVYCHLRDGYTLSAELKESLGTLFKSRVMVGTTYEFREKVDYPVDITINIKCNEYYSQKETKALAEAYIRDTFFAPNSFTFGDSLDLSDIETQLKDTFAGIKSARITTPNSVTISPDEEYKVITLGTLTIEMSGGIA